MAGSVGYEWSFVADVESIDRLIELQMQLGKWTSLLDSYERKAEVVSDPEVRLRRLPVLDVQLPQRLFQVERIRCCR